VNVVFRVGQRPFEPSPQQGSLPHCWGRTFAAARLGATVINFCCRTRSIQSGFLMADGLLYCLILRTLGELS
jgi:hypothetical protein